MENTNPSQAIVAPSSSVPSQARPASQWRRGVSPTEDPADDLVIVSEVEADVTPQTMETKQDQDQVDPFPKDQNEPGEVAVVVAQEKPQEVEADQTVPLHAIFRGLSNVCINWKSSKQLAGDPEKHDGKDISFAVYVAANMGVGIGDNGTEIGCMLHLPCMLEVCRSTDGQRRNVEALFVMRNKRGCVFVIFDGTDNSYSFVKPNEIGALLGFLPSRKDVARARIGDAILAFERETTLTKKKAKITTPTTTKRARCLDWQSALLDLCSALLPEDATDTQKMKLETLRESLNENTRPKKATKSVSASTSTSTSTD